jgi:hypothetical protein
VGDPSLADRVASYKPKDEQRRFQLEVAGIALREGTAGLARRWLQLGRAEQRRDLLQEIGDAQLAIAALEEPDDKVRGYAVLCAIEAAQKGALDASARARITQALLRVMARHEERPLGLFWLERYVELLGHTGDISVVAQLERLRPFAGASRRTTVETLDPENLPMPYPRSAGDFPAGVPVPVARVLDVGTGLLEIKLLEDALKRIRARH